MSFTLFSDQSKSHALHSHERYFCANVLLVHVHNGPERTVFISLSLFLDDVHVPVLIPMPNHQMEGNGQRKYFLSRNLLQRD